ncbi:acyltransferase family protein [Pantoea sp. Z09]|uniref:acyltransferase family protein n=1 Tax=Pantoea sp. Z09 TaxID=2886821 RepID=UPI001EFE5079|nr:acyltransferase family protein [Pantoea sp. Z09]
MKTRSIQGYRADIDGLRAVAILLVVLFHAGVSALPGGYAGVDIFFVISGFLIGGILSRDIASGQFSFYSFYVRRIRRIAPALMVMLFSLLFIGYFLLSPLEYGQLAKYSFGVFLSVPNIILLKGSDYFSASADLNPLLMSWSLGIEEQFYVALPFVLLLAAWLRRSMAGLVLLLSLLSLAGCIWLTPQNSSQAFYLLPTRAWELGAGVMLALWKPQPLSGRWANLFTLAGLALTAYCALTLNKSDAFPGYLALLPVLAACLLIAARGALSRLVLENAPMRFIGKISYSWYLWHWPLLALARICSDGPISVSQGLGVSALALVVAWLSWRYVEQPFRRPVRKPRSVIPTYCLMSVAAAAAMVGLWASGGLTWRVNDKVISSEAYKIAAQTNPCLLDAGPNLPSQDKRCQPDASRPGVALVGDSHAAAMRTAVARYAEAQQKPLYQLTKATCPLLAAGVTRAVYQQPAHAKQCAAFNDAVMKELLSDRISEVVMTAFWASGIETLPGAGYRDINHPDKDNLSALKQGMDAVIAQLRQAGKKVVLIEDAPSLSLDALRYSNNRNMPLRRELSQWLSDWKTLPTQNERTTRYSLPEDALTRLLRGYEQRDVRVVSLRENLCNRSGCLVTWQGLPLYYDNNHLSPQGVEIALGSRW